MTNKLYFYFGKTNAIILSKFYRGYRLYFWNTETDVITKGQWLMKGKIVTTTCRVSEDCKYFEYKLKQHAEGIPEIYLIHSIAPYFSAIRIESLNMDGPPKRGNKPKVKSWRGIGSIENYDVEINKENTILTKDNKILLDTTNDVFESIEAPYEKV